jgi:hypothetical protein
MAAGEWKPKPQYVMWEGTRLPRKTDFDDLGEVLAKVYEMGRGDGAPGRIRVFDREPYMGTGALWLVWDSKQKEVK